MDPERRKQLEARRAALKADPPRAIEGRISAALIERGVPFEPRFDGIWTPPYIRVAGNGLWWPDSPEPAMTEWCGTTERDDPDGSTQRVLRQTVIARMLKRATGTDTPIRFSYDSGFETHVELTRRDAMANLDVLLDFNLEIYITSKAENWLIELHDHVARLAMPPELDAEEETRRATLARLYASPLTEALDKLGWPYELVRDDDPDHPMRPRHVFNDKPGIEKESLRLGIPAGDVQRLQEDIVAFVAARCDPEATLVASLGLGAYPNNLLGSPYLLMPVDALAPAFPAFVDMGNRYIDDPPLEGTLLRHVELWSTGDRWLLTVDFTPQWWRIRAWG